jgi:hypothetical protein
MFCRSRWSSSHEDRVGPDDALNKGNHTRAASTFTLAVDEADVEPKRLPR